MEECSLKIYLKNVFTPCPIDGWNETGAPYSPNGNVTNLNNTNSKLKVDFFRIMAIRPRSSTLLLGIENVCNLQRERKKKRAPCHCHWVRCHWCTRSGWLRAMLQHFWGQGSPLFLPSLSLQIAGTVHTVLFPLRITSQTVPTQPDLQCPQSHRDTTQPYTHPIIIYMLYTYKFYIIVRYTEFMHVTHCKITYGIDILYLYLLDDAVCGFQGI